MNKKIKIVNFLFSFIVILFLGVGFIKPILKPIDYNYRENRYAYQLPKFSKESFANGDFQNEYELALSDQIPLAANMKLVEKTISLIEKEVYYWNRKDTYNNMGGMYLFNDNLVYYHKDLSQIKSKIDTKVKNFNSVIKDKNNVYLYYIEKDTDINFENNQKNGEYEYLEEQLGKDFKITKFSINSLKEFKNYFYRTDHHWNYKGSYKAYTELVKFLNLDNPIKNDVEKCLNSTLSGSKSAVIGGSVMFREKFCYYDFDIPKYKIYINNELQKNYTDRDYYITNNPFSVGYAGFYGNDYGLLEFDFNNPSKGNLLIIGESYDNAINELLASHFNKTFNVDLRHYENDIGKKFDYNEFINENNIDIVLFIGNTDFYTSSNFML